MLKTLRPVVVLNLFCLVLLLSACGGKKIRTVMGDPGRYASKAVTVEGDVVDSFGILGNGAYKIDDDTGTLWVVSRGGIPRKGARVQAKGRIRDIVSAGSLPGLPGQIQDRIGNGLVMIEASRKAK